MREMRLWLDALRSVSNNPVAHYLRVSRQRLHQRHSAVRRYLLLTISGAAALILTGYLFIRLYSESASPAETVLYLWFFLLTTVTVVLTLIGLRLIAATSADVLRVLAPTDGSSRQQLVDESLAASAISDHDIVVGVLSAVVPPLARVSIGGGVLTWLWLAAVTSLGSSFGAAEFARALIAAPLTIGGMVLSGTLGAIALALWLFCLGRGSGLYSATITSLLLSAGHLLYVLLILALVVFTQLSGSIGGHAGLLFPWLAFRLLAIGLFSVGFDLLLSDAIRHYRASSCVALFSPLILPLVIAILLVYVPFASYAGQSMRVLPLIVGQTWGATMLVNPLAVPSRLCLWREIGDYVGWLELNFLLLLGHQLILIAIGAQKARLAVALWRQRPV